MTCRSQFALDAFVFEQEADLSRSRRTLLTPDSAHFVIINLSRSRRYRRADPFGSTFIAGHFDYGADRGVGWGCSWCLYYNDYTMSPRERVMTFRPDNDTLEAMKSLRERDGVPFSEQIRRALRMWLESKGIRAQERKRPATRKKVVK